MGFIVFQQLRNIKTFVCLEDWNESARCKSGFYLNIICGKQLTGRKTTLYVAIVIVVLVYILALAGAIVIQNVWILAVTTGVAVFSLYMISNQIKNRKKVRYPLVPPEGKSDMYVPRTNIPRPVIEDFRKAEEKKKKFAKLRRMAQRAVRPKKK